MILGSFRVPKSMQHEVRNGLGNRIVDKRAQDRQKTAPRRRKTPQGLQVGADLDPRGVPKSIRIRSWAPKGTPKLPRTLPRPSQDPPKTPNRLQIDSKSTREVEIQKLPEIELRSPETSITQTHRPPYRSRRSAAEAVACK